MSFITHHLHYIDLLLWKLQSIWAGFSLLAMQEGKIMKGNSNVEVELCAHSSRDWSRGPSQRVSWCNSVLVSQILSLNRPAIWSVSEVQRDWSKIEAVIEKVRHRVKASVKLLSLGTVTQWQIKYSSLMSFLYRGGICFGHKWWYSFLSLAIIITLMPVSSR